MSGIRESPRVALATIGCKLNQYETEGMRESLTSAGACIVPFNAEADVYIVNTCTVTSRADYKSRQLARRAHRTNPQALVVVTGCYATTNPEELAEIDGVGLVLPLSEKGLLVERLAPYGIKPNGSPRPLVRGFSVRSRAFLKVQEGCDFTCTFCKVRLARGKPKSEPLPRVLEAARALIDGGYREIVLTGINLGGYQSNGVDLAGLLERLMNLPGLGRLRLSSIEPNLVTPAIKEMLAEKGKLAAHIHLPLQSGSERILRLMGRRYTPQHFTSLVEELAERVPGIGIGADVIVGFPGETDDDFGLTVQLIERLPVTYLHVFSYSHRPGTPAAGMDGRVEPQTKKVRSESLRTLGKEKNLLFRQAMIKTELTVLVESSPPAEAEGLSENYLRVRLPGTVGFHNRFIPVRIDSIEESGTTARAVGDAW